VAAIAQGFGAENCFSAVLREFETFCLHAIAASRWSQSMQPVIAFISSDTAEAVAAALHLAALYGQARPEEAEVIVALGGDGFMLQSLHRFMNSGKRIFGMNRGSVGFLMNEYRDNGLAERIAVAIPETIRPLEMIAQTKGGKAYKAIAINEVSLLRQSYQAAKLRIVVDGKERLDELICDGVMVATPAGSTAYNLSAQGPILPLDAPLLALTPVSPFRPRRWRGALLPNRSVVDIEILEQDKRPVNAVADHNEVKSVRNVSIRQSETLEVTLLFDEGHSWDERILAEQFRY
jgi:NAD+ kinase